ncbi:MAG: hypothetical protein LBG27_13950 [Spirochaetaceae bacterium]|jgi:hypothetical protein|nr:hypothetical protein [Spirochaetaceae bacterium]
MPLSWNEIKARASAFVLEREWHRNQNRKSVKVRRKKAAARTAEIKAYKEAHPGTTTREMGLIFDVSPLSVSRALRDV